MRQDSNRFVVLRDHVYPEVERVVWGNERFVVVAKVGEGAELAEELDPRE